MNLKMKKLLAIIMIFSMIIAAGCQAVSGLDLNQVIKNMTKVTSAEGKYELEFKLNVNEEEWRAFAAGSGEDREATEQMLEMLRQYSHIKLVIDKYKMQDQQHLSLKGSIAFGDQSKIGFDLKATDKLAVIKLDGAKQPFSIDLTGEHAELLRRHYYETELGWDYDEVFGIDESDQVGPTAADEEAVVAAVQQITELVTDFTAGHLPNVERLSVEPVTEQINGEATELLAVKGEIKGMELWQWAKKLINAIADDRQGLEKLISGIFDIYHEQEAAFIAFGLDGAGSYIYGIPGAVPVYPTYPVYEDEYLEEGMEDYLYEEEMWEEEALPEEVELTPEEAKKQAVDEILAMLDELKLSMTELEQEDEKTLKQVLNDSLLVTFDYGVDKKLNVRKQNVALQYTIDSGLKNELELFGINGFSLTASSQLWNVNGEVKAEEPATTLSTVSIESLEYKQGFEIAELFEEGSFIDKVLREQMHITAQTYWNYVDEEMEGSVYMNAKKQAMIPAREIIEEFGGKVTYNKQTKQIFLLDKATNTTIEISVGSNNAIINGEQVQWSAPVELYDGMVYVPARAMAEALNAEIYWSNWGYLEITREP